jgi:hypothetical protein
MVAGRCRSQPVRSLRRCLLYRVIRVVADCSRLRRAGLVTPEVAGSRPVAPVENYLHIASLLPRWGAIDRRFLARPCGSRSGGRGTDLQAVFALAAGQTRLSSRKRSVGVDSRARSSGATGCLHSLPRQVAGPLGQSDRWRAQAAQPPADEVDGATLVVLAQHLGRPRRLDRRPLEPAAQHRLEAIHLRAGRCAPGAQRLLARQHPCTVAG